MDKYAKARELLKACWEGYEMVGMKRKGGRSVPNCVPKKKAEEESVAKAEEYAGRMVKSNLYKLIQQCNDLYGMFEDNENVEPWVEEKIAVAASMIDSVAHYVEHEHVADGDVAKTEKKYSKKVTNPETGREKTVRYGAKGYSIAPGTSRGDSYCARSAGQMKDHPAAAKDPNSPLRLSRKKWRCSGSKSTKKSEDDAIEVGPEEYLAKAQELLTKLRGK